MYLRLKAALFVFLLIGGLSLASIGALALLGPLVAHGANVQHSDGSIVTIGPGRDFVLKTATGASLDFQCRMTCRASLGHLQRHLLEHAHTDVYYIAGKNNSYQAVDVD